MSLLPLLAALAALAIPCSQARDEAIERVSAHIPRGDNSVRGNAPASWGKHGAGHGFGKFLDRRRGGGGGAVSRWGNRRGQGTNAAAARGSGVASNLLSSNGNRFAKANALLTDEDIAEQQLEDFADASPRDQKKFSRNLHGLTGQGGDGSRTAIVNRYEGNDANLRALVRDARGRRKGGTLKTQGCDSSGDAQKCKNADWVSDQGDYRAKMIPSRSSTDDVKKGTFDTFDKNGEITDPGQQFFEYEVQCSGSGRGRTCQNSPVSLRWQDGRSMDCKPDGVSGRKSKCCQKGHARRGSLRNRLARRDGCVDVTTDADGNTEVRKDGTKVAGSACTPSRTRRGSTNQVYKCGTNTAGDLNTQAENIEAISSPNCRSQLPNDREIIIRDAKYSAGTKETNPEFPHCGTLTAELVFKGFSPDELREIGPRLAMQWDVLAKPAGHLKCRDDVACLAQDVPNDPIPGDNCYYCEACNKQTNVEGFQSIMTDNSLCEETPRTKQKVSARICPLPEGEENKMCTMFTKTATEPYWRVKSDVIFKLALYLRANPNTQKAAMEGFVKDTSGFLGIAKKFELQAKKLGNTDALLGKFFNTRGREPTDSDYEMLKIYMRSEGKATKGTLLTCQKLKLNYKLFGDVAKIADAAMVAGDFKSLLGSKNCKGLYRARMSKANRNLGRNRFGNGK